MRHPWMFDFVLLGCGLFIILTVIAMFWYPGGTMVDDATQGYSFFHNFFSELGFTTAHGRSNQVGAGLFFVALTLVGFGLGLFFLAFPRFFEQERRTRWLAWFGSGLGLLSAVCFIGVACTPANLNMALHKTFVMWAFRLLPVAIFCYIPAMSMTHFPLALRGVFIAFFLLLMAYLLLLEFGPEIDTYNGMVIQATGQKVIVYSSILSIMVQAFWARKRLKTSRD